jgi:GWxTD domain-containing protein
MALILKALPASRRLSQGFSTILRPLIYRVLMLSMVFAAAYSGYAWSQSGAVRKEAAAKSYYQKWLEQDVCWIITEEERDVYTRLANEDEREAFIQQFWERRNPDPSSADNMFKVEHYRRIMYANERFSAGIAGWKSDRGMIYIKFGPPDRQQSWSAGGPYERERKEGGGFTSIFPTERWEYRHIEGVGDDVELEFVDDKGGGLYELTFDKQRKDALLLSGNMGLTQDELEAGVSNKQDRVARRRYSGDYKGVYSNMNGFESARDKPLAQIGMSAALNRAPLIKYKDLETAVSAHISYEGFPFEIRQDSIRLTDQQALVPVTVLVPNEQMTFTSTLGLYHGGVQIFGRVVGLNNRIEAMFEDEVVRDFLPEDYNKTKSRSSIYQKRLILKPGIYKIDIAVKDIQSKHIGIITQRLEVPHYDTPKLQTSSILIASKIDAGIADRTTTSFLLGDLKIIPKMDDSFRRSEELGLYLQIYNFALDGASSQPALKVEYAVAQKGAEPDAWRDSTKMIRFAGSYCRLARMINLSRLQPGIYQLRVRIHDTISGQATETAVDFTVRS